MKKRFLIWGFALLLMLALSPLSTFATETDPAQNETVQGAQDGDNQGENSEDAQDETDKDEDGEDEEPQEEFVPLEGYLETEQHPVYINGSSDLVHPNGKLTRAEASSMIYSLLKEKYISDTRHFADVKTGAWYQPQVDALAELGVVTGKGEGRFDPGANITRAEFVTILAKFFPMEEGEPAFKDLKPGSWYYPYMVNAIAKGWVNGYEDNTVRPGNNITRAEAAAVLNNVLGRSADKSRIDIYGKDGKILRFIDLPFTHWAYYHIMEASIIHTHGEKDGKESWTYIAVPRASRTPGYHLYEGDLYKVDDTGHFVRNTTDGVLRFDDNGRYTSGNTTLDALLKSVVVNQTVEGDSRMDNLERLYNYVCYKFSYLTRRPYPAYGSSGWEPSWALTMITTRKGNCYSYAALFAMLARRLGYQATAQSGQVHLNWDGSFVDHGWVQISLDGRTYFCDPECQGIYCVQVHRNWNLFMKPYSQSTLPRYRIGSRYLK